jgi:hypothetical protein
MGSLNNYPDDGYGVSFRNVGFYKSPDAAALENVIEVM